MKIYFIGQKGIPGRSGGVETHVEELSSRLAKSGHDVYVYTRPNYTDPNLKKYKGVNLISLPSVATKHLDAISHTFKACLDVIHRDADIIHFHSIGPSSLIWLVKIFKPGVPVVSTFHTRDYFHKKWGVFARICLKLGEAAACLLPDRTIAVSHSLKKYADEKYGINTVYIPNGVNIPRYLSAKEIKRWNLEKGNYILTVSRLVRHKGVHHLIEAYNQIKTGKKLVIVGDGSFTDDYVWELRLLADGNKNIIFTGAQSGETLKELFSNSYLFVQPSESEGLSIALLEAMSYKKTCLVSDIPENIEAIEDAGFLFKNMDPDSLAEKLRYLLKHPALVKSKEIYGYDRAKIYYSWKNITKDVIKVYNMTILARTERSGIFKLKFVRKFISFLF